MTVSKLLADLREKDIIITANGDKLKVNAPAGVLTAELKQMIAVHRSELLAILETTSLPECTAAPWVNEAIPEVHHKTVYEFLDYLHSNNLQVRNWDWSTYPPRAEVEPRDD